MLRLTIFTKAERCKGVDKATRVEKLLKATFFISPPSLEFCNEAIMHYLRGSNIRVERSFGIWTALLICLTGWRLGDVLVKITFFSSTLLIPLHIPASASNSKSRSMQRCWQSNKESGVETFRINLCSQDTRQGEPLHHVRVLSIKRFTVKWNVSYRNNAACLSLSFADNEIMQSMNKTPPPRSGW